MRIPLGTTAAAPPATLTPRPPAPGGPGAVAGGGAGGRPAPVPPRGRNGPAAGAALLALALLAGAAAAPPPPAVGATAPRPAAPQYTPPTPPTITPTPTITFTPTNTPACGLAWRRVPAPLGPTGAWPRAAAALGPDDVWSVGVYATGGYPNYYYSLTTHWDGTAWTVIPSPNPRPNGDNLLLAVAALAPDDVWAAGYLDTYPTSAAWILHWTGRAWVDVPLPATGFPQNALYSISALAPDNIWAAGYTGTGSISQGLIPHYDGTAWTQVPAPLHDQRIELGGIALIAPDDGWVTGSYWDPSGVWRPLALHWDGSYWTVGWLATGYGSSNLTHLVMTAHDQAWAHSDLGGLVHYDGSSWTPVSLPSGGGITASAARGPADVWAVGTTYGTAGALLLHYDGRGWTAFPNYAAAYGSAVAIVEPGDVWALGDYTVNGNRVLDALHYRDPCVTPQPTGTAPPTGTGTPPTATVPRPAPPTHTRVPSYTPTPPASPSPTCSADWARAPAPDPGLYDQATLAGLAVLGPSDIWAAGTYHNPAPPYETAPYLVHWNGTAWSQAPAPSRSPEPSYLYAVAARAPNDVWAVGYYQSYTYQRFLPLVLHWDGTAWTSETLPLCCGIMRGVGVAGPDDVWVVGDGSQVLHRTAAGWSVVTLPDHGVPIAELSGVAGRAADDVWVAGFDTSSCLGSPILEHWNGQAWTIVPTSGAGLSNRVYGLFALAPDDVWAVGAQSPYCNGGDYVSLVLHWDGSAWTTVPSPDPDPGFLGVTELTAIGGAARDDLWAVGATTSGDRALIKHWNGSAWQDVGIPPVSGMHSLTGVSAAASNDVWAVGVAGRLPLVERYHACGGPTPGPSRTPRAEDSPTRTATTPPATRVPTGTATPCAIRFSDVQPPDYFYAPVQDLACGGAISGYGDGTFRPYNPTTRAQQVKIVVLGLALRVQTPPAGGYTFADVPPAQPFFPYVETAAAQQMVSGYGCGGPGEPCDDLHRPYFRPNANVTRGQVSKMTVAAATWRLLNPARPTFADVLPGSAFYAFVETAACHGLISGYRCGGPGEPCDDQQRPYFRQYNTATRGQIAKIVYGALTAGGACDLAR